MPTTTPDNIFYAGTTTPMSIEDITAMIATSVQTALNGRAQQTFLWSNATARNAQTGMNTGDEGLQQDTGVTYKFLSGAWKAWLSDWVAYTATQTSFNTGTGGSATADTQYKYTNGDVRVRYNFVFGTSGTTFPTAPSFSLPVQASVVPVTNYVYSSMGAILDASAPATNLAYTRANATSVTSVQIQTLVSGATATITTTVPWTWAQADTMSGDFTYRAA